MSQERARNPLSLQSEGAGEAQQTAFFPENKNLGVRTLAFRRSLKILASSIEEKTFREAPSSPAGFPASSSPPPAVGAASSPPAVCSCSTPLPQAASCPGPNPAARAGNSLQLPHKSQGPPPNLGLLRLSLSLSLSFLLPRRFRILKTVDSSG